MITLALRFLKTKAGIGLALSAGILLAVGSSYRLGVWRGVRDGIVKGTTTERAAWSAEVVLARNSALASQVAAKAATSALQDTVGTLRTRVAALSEAAAMARGNYRAALAAYERTKVTRVDSLPLVAEQVACDELARACAVAVATAQAERDTLFLTLAAAERRARVQDSVIATEPVRTTLSNQEAMAAQRDAFKSPSRVKWAAGGAGVGAAIALLLQVLR
jgi:hypothetical protein